MISASSISTFDPDTLRLSTSADGLTFGAKTALTGITPEAEATFGNPAFLAFDNGTFLMLYEDIKHVSSAAVDINRMRRAISMDGSAFTNEPSTVFSPGGSLVSIYLQPSLVRIDNTKIRMFYTSSQSTQTALSTDEGQSFGAEDTVAVIGRSDAYAPFLGDPTVIIDQSGRYLMFFISVPTSADSDSAIFFADSSDGKTFHVFDQPALVPTAGTSFQDPAAIVLNDGSIRLYYIARTGGASRTVKSALSN